MDNPDDSHGPFTLSLSADEALVLFECLARSDDQQRVEIVHPAERHALRTVEGQLERALVATFDARYAELLAAARARLAPAE
jgi:hypothetical protein